MAKRRKAGIPEVALRARERFGSSVLERARKLRLEEAQGMPSLPEEEPELIAEALEVFLKERKEQQRRLKRLLREGMPELPQQALEEVESARRALRGGEVAEAAEALQRASQLASGQARLYLTELAQRCLRGISTSFSVEVR